MNKIISRLYLMAFLLFFQISIAQKTVQVEADFIGIDYPSELYFYKKNKDGSYENTIVKSNYTETTHFTHIKEHDTIILVSNLKQQSSKEIFKKTSERNAAYPFGSR